MFTSFFISISAFKIAAAATAIQQLICVADV